MVGNALGGKQGFEVGILNHIGQFGGLVSCVNQYGHRAAQDNAKEHFHNLDKIRSKNADMVARLNPHSLECTRLLLRPLGKLCVSQALAWKYQCFVVRPLVCRTQ